MRKGRWNRPLAKDSSVSDMTSMQVVIGIAAYTWSWFIMRIFMHLPLSICPSEPRLALYDAFLTSASATQSVSQSISITTVMPIQIPIPNHRRYYWVYSLRRVA